MAPDEILLDLTIDEADADPERLDELTRYLLRDLRELGAESVERASGGVVPAGAKGGPAAVGALDLVAQPAFLPRLFGFLQAWAQRGESRRIKIAAPNGAVVEFTADRALSPADLAAYVEALSGGAPAGVATGQGLPQAGDRTRLRQILSTRFDAEELRTLCFELGVDYDSLRGEGKESQARELVAYLERRGRIGDLLGVGRRLRPDVPWE